MSYVVARLGVNQGVGLASTGNHKGRPYEGGDFLKGVTGLVGDGLVRPVPESVANARTGRDKPVPYESACPR